MIVGEWVRVEREVQTGLDPFGSPITETVTEDVENVLVIPGARADLSPGERPEGVRIAWNLHFPKGYPANLRGARVSVRGGEPLPVVGDPQHYTEANTPGPWSMPCELEAVYG